MSKWFSPVPHDYNETRITLDFGLSAVTRHYNDIIVPKIGTVRKLRSFSYALSGILLSKELEKYSKTSTYVAHAIEALANKIYWEKNQNEQNISALGINGFKKYPGVWKCDSLLDYYVKSNTMRQSTVSALKNFNLVNGGTFNSFSLEPRGEIIADSFLSIGNNIREILKNWIKGAGIDIEKLAPITFNNISKNENKLIVDVLKSIDPDGNIRRKELWEIFESGNSYKKLSDEQHKKDIELVESFEALKKSLINFYLDVAMNIGKDISQVKITHAQIINATKEYENKQRLSGLTHKNLSSILNMINSNKGSSLTRAIIDMERDLIYRDDNNKIQKGSMFDLNRIKSLRKENTSSELPRLSQLRSLVDESI